MSNKYTRLSIVVPTPVEVSNQQRHNSLKCVKIWNVYFQSWSLVGWK